MTKGKSKSDDRPIGIFDSGVGGLTVTKAVIDELPGENIIYIGDTTRIPYGTRSRETITKFALEMVVFLLKKKVKVLVVACNTISANSLEIIKKRSSVPVIDVISPTLETAKNLGKVAVIATRSTINSGAYESVAKLSQACPLFVPLAEEGMIRGLAVEEIARGYLSGLKKAKIDTLILGCTHYPLLRSVIAKTMGDRVKLIDSGKPTAKKLHQFLAQKGLLAKNSNPAYQFLFTDSPQQVVKAASHFFGNKLPGVIAKIDL